MKKVLIILFLTASQFAISQSDAEFEKEFLVSQIKLVCTSLNEDNKSTFNCYIKEGTIYCDADFYIEASYKPSIANEIDKTLSNNSREIIFNRIVMQMKKGGVIDSIGDSLTLMNYTLTFKIRFNTKDGTVLKYNYFITCASLSNISKYLNKEDFNNNLHAMVSR